MVTVTQIKHGLSRFIDTEILPHLTGSQRFGATVYLSLALEQTESLIRDLMKQPALSMLSLMDADGNIDIDRMKNAAVSAFDSTDKLEFDVPVIGRITLRKGDLDKLYGYIVG